MENYNNINDKDLNRLLKQRLLELEDDALLEAEAKLVFSSAVVVAPDIKKEEAFLKKLKKTKGRFGKWFFPGMSIFISAVVLFCFYQHSTKHIHQEASAGMQLPAEQAAASHSDQGPNTFSKKLFSPSVSNNNVTGAKEENDTINTSFKHSHLGLYTGQLIDHILKENGDCSSPIIIHDSIIVLAHSPVGAGNELEISDSTGNDAHYFEKEHNIVWYKFSVKENCKLVFDITPNNKWDDFDFMLFQYEGPDFSSQLQDRKVTPVRTCISRNEEGLDGKTGLNYDNQAPAFVHSDAGPSHVRYVPAQKGQIFYLVVDHPDVNISNHSIKSESRGYTIRFRYKHYDPDELFVGKSIANKIYFIADEYVFRSNSGYEAAIDSIYRFLKAHPKIKVEIQGHVNSTELQKQNGKKTRSQLLSENRARAVYDCLVEEGIDSLRMLPVGYAGSRKKIQNPKTIAESSKNVRVDVVILSLDYEADLKLVGQRTDKNKN